MPSVIAAFLGLLFSTISAHPQALFSSQSVGALWAQAQTQVAAEAHPSPTASAIALAYDPDDDGDNDAHHRHHHHPSPAPSPAATTPGSSLVSAAYPDASSTPIAIASLAPQAASSTATATAAADPAPVPADALPSSLPVRTSMPQIADVYAVSPRRTPAPGQPAVYSARFTAPNNPFHTTVADLEARGATAMPSSLVSNLWAQGYYSQWSGMPVYSTSASDPTAVISCTKWGACDANGVTIHVPANAMIQPGTDAHIIVQDQASGGEFDGWMCQQPSGGHLNCAWGGWYPFSGKGLKNNGSDGIHSGYAHGLYVVAASEILHGHIAHALGINAESLADPVYPADTANHTDQNCGDRNSNPCPVPPYGALVHLKLTPAQIIATGAGYECTVVLNALAEYGAYTYDTGNLGLEIAVENTGTYSPGANPWYSAILPRAAREGDSQGSGADASWKSCLNLVSASDFEILRAPELGY